LKEESSSVSEQDERQAVVQQRPATHDQDEWKAYWKTQGQSWRTEPEIATDRQKYLDEQGSITPDIVHGIYPFKDIKLARADIEWLLATHQKERGPIDWSDKSQREREGIDLRGADLRQANLAGLPLARMQGGLRELGWLVTTEEQRSLAAVHLEAATLQGAQLQGAALQKAQLQQANLWEAQLQHASLVDAKLKGVSLVGAQLQGADLWGAQLQHANLYGAQLQGADLRRADLDHARLDQVTLSDQTDGSAFFADITWGEINLAAVDWKAMTRLGDEQVAQQDKDSDGTRKDTQTRVGEYQSAVRACRQLAVILREQGLNEEADRFAYRAQLLQRKVFWREHAFGRWLFSMLLAVLSGYGYRIWRILAAYIVTVSVFALIYFVLGRYYPPHLPLHHAFLESITAFHGRVFLEQFNLDTPQIWFTALEALAGLIIEGVFIAMLIQRFFGR
jgi:uncharacterized protein YjbI with pentapeptide repeats